MKFRLIMAGIALLIGLIAYAISASQSPSSSGPQPTPSNNTGGLYLQ